MKKTGTVILLAGAFLMVTSIITASYDLFGIPYYILFNLLFTVAFFYALVWIFRALFFSRKKVELEEVPVLTKEKEARYEELGMSPSEIELFRSTMNGTKQQINRLQKNIAQSSKLKAIDLRHDTLKAAKALFKHLVKEPTRLHDASHFLYTHLPNMADLTDKYLEINEHEIKSKETFAKLEESAQVIDQLATLIVQDYQQFVAEDLEDLDVEISIAKQSLKRDNELKSELK